MIEKRFLDKGLEDVKLMKSRQKELVKKEQPQKTQAEIDLMKAIQVIADSTSSQEKPSIKGIRSNRQREQIREHKNYVGEVIVNG